VGALYTKVKEGSDQETTNLLKEGKKHWREITDAEWKQRQPV